MNYLLRSKQDSIAFPKMRRPRVELDKCVLKKRDRMREEGQCSRRHLELDEKGETSVLSEWNPGYDKGSLWKFEMELCDFAFVVHRQTISLRE